MRNKHILITVTRNIDGDTRHRGLYASEKKDLEINIGKDEAMNLMYLLENYFRVAKNELSARPF